MQGGKLRHLLPLTAAVVLAVPLEAHRLDEVLQAARLDVAPDRVVIQLDLTPGAALADTFIAALDGDGDGILSSPEQQAYAGIVRGDLALVIDGQPLSVQTVSAAFPALPALRAGEGTIQLQFGAVVPGLSDGAHQLLFQNGHGGETSVYLANALVPQSARVAVTAQRRDPHQRHLTIDFILRQPPQALTAVWWLTSITVVGLAAVVARRRHLLRPSR